MAKSKQQTEITNRIFMYLSVLGAAAFITLGIVALWTHNFTGNMVKKELAAQKIYFPVKGSPGFEATTYPDLQQYADQLVDSPDKAKAYANGYIGRHLKKIANGKVYSEVSAESMKNPSDQKLQQQKQMLFQGETLRGMLLTSGYGFGTIGNIAGIVAYIAFAMCILSVASAVYFKTRS
jgi:hypothetical protein